MNHRTLGAATAAALVLAGLAVGAGVSAAATTPVDKTLTFDSENGQEYEMRPTGSDTAELRFVATNRDESWFALRRVK